jgi:hypothetical protein
MIWKKSHPGDSKSGAICSIASINPTIQQTQSDENSQESQKNLRAQ